MKLFFVSLGCDKNRVDSEKILRHLIDKKNVEVVYDPVEADVAVVNTCSFIRDAKDESIEWINYLSKLKQKKILKKIMVLGCFATEKYMYNGYDDVYKDVDVILPLNKYVNSLNCLNDRVNDILSFSSFIKICDGCDKFCSYCIIPHLRGRLHSNSIENIISECKKLAKNGTKELCIVGQDVLSYGKDLYGKKMIVPLIDEISKIEGIEWIRLLYCYPEEIDDDLISLFKTNKKLLPYIDMPIQHSSNRILKLMNRRTTKENIINVVDKLRKEVEKIVIRTTILVGFPSETEDDFDELCKFIKMMRFDKLGVFSYSREKLSKSYNLPNQISDIIKEKRRKKIFDIQKNIVLESNKKHIGIVYNSLVEGYDMNKKMYVVRPYFNAREIDDKVYVKTKEELISGTFVNVEIKKQKGFDLIGEIV